MDSASTDVPLRRSTVRFWRQCRAVAQASLAALAAAWIALGISDIVRTARASRWPVTSGTVENSDHAGAMTIYHVQRTNGNVWGQSYPGLAVLRYRFVVHGDTVVAWRANVTQPAPDGFRVRPRAWFWRVAAPG